MTEETESKFRMIWDTIKLWTYKFVGGLIMEQKTGGTQVVSIGRILLLCVMGWMFAYWTGWAQAAMITADSVVDAFLSQGLVYGPEFTSEMMYRTADKVVMALPKKDLPPGLLEVFFALLTYVGGGKVVHAAKETMARKYP